ncbi:DUF2254 domain-containing protein [soil metagenome]
MIPELGWLRSVITGRFFLRAGLFGLAAVLLALVAAPIGGLFPGLGEWVDEPSIRDLLEVIASNMLLVATFSLGTMVAAYTAASRTASPRATKVLIDDPISQNVLSTFVGAFVFAIIGLVGLSFGVYGEGGRVLLVIAASLVVLLVIVTLFGWIDYLANLVRLGAVLNKVEAAAAEAMKGRNGAPHLGARPAGRAPVAGHAVRVEETGYITRIDLDCLDRIAARHGGRVRVSALPGAFVGRAVPVAAATFRPSPEEAAELARAFTVTAERSIDQDPRYGLIVLTEVASRALSSGVNDFGTAISVIGRLQRLLTLWADAPQEGPEIHFPNVEAPGIDVRDLAEDAFGPLARDGARLVEVGIRLQKALAALAGLGRPDLAEAALRQSERALAQAEDALVLASDRDEIARLAAGVADAAGARP